MNDTISMRNGLAHPVLGYGTYKVGFVPESSSTSSTVSNHTPHSAEECITDALSLGYRFFECAEFYNNEEMIGRAIKRSGVSREDLFLCSKVWTSTIERGPGEVRKSFEKTCHNLGTKYLDLYLIHWPVPGNHVQAYRELETLYQEGKVRGIGLSNYTIEDYLELKDAGFEVEPVVNQIEINPFLYRKNTINFFKNEGIFLQSYRSLRNGKAMDHPVIVRLAKSHGRTSAQILGRWCIQKGFGYFPKSDKKERMIENANVFDFHLADEEIEELDCLTTSEAINEFEALYRKCVNRDTSKDGTIEGVKVDITLN